MIGMDTAILPIRRHPVDRHLIDCIGKKCVAKRWLKSGIGWSLTYSHITPTRFPTAFGRLRFEDLYLNWNGGLSRTDSDTPILQRGDPVCRLPPLVSQHVLPLT
jgi:hypothetical protein